MNSKAKEIVIYFPEVDKLVVIFAIVDLKAKFGSPCSIDIKNLELCSNAIYLGEL